MSVLVVSDAHVCVPFFFLVLSFVCLVWLITGCLGFWCVGWVLGCLFSCAGRPTVFVFGVCCWVGWLLLVRVVVWCFLGWWLVLLAGRDWWCVPVGYWVVVPCCLCLRAVSGVWAGVCAWWCVRVGVCGERGCLGAGCVVAGGVLPCWLGDAVAGGGASVGFDVGLRVFTFGGVSVPGSGSSPVVLVSGEAGFCSVSGSGVSSVVAVSSGSSSGVRVCVPCARVVFGDSWCGLVLRRWCAAAGVDVAQAVVLLGSAPVSGGVGGGSAVSLRSSAFVVASSSGFVPLSGSAAGSVSSASLRSSSAGGGRVGVGFGARVRDWGARVGVGGGVVSGGGVLSGWWGRWRERASGLASSVGVWGLVLAGLVGVVVLVSVLVLVG